MKKFISIFLLLYITLPINAQDKTNELSGFIIHKQENGSNGSLDGANIFLIYAKDTLKTTSINGVFRFKPIKTGKAKLIITAIGCRKVEKELNIIAGKNSNLYIEILDESIQLEEVTIKGRNPHCDPKWRHANIQPEGSQRTRRGCRYEYSRATSRNRD